MTTISHSSAALFRCEKGDNCEFFKHYAECQQYHDQQPKQNPCQSKVELSLTSKLLMNTAQRGVWAGIGAATNYLSGGDPIAGALFNPLSSEVNRGLNFVISKLPLSIKKDMSLAHVAKALTVKGISMFAVASVLNTLGYPVTNTTLVVNLIPRIAIIALGSGLGVAAKAMEAGAEGIAHMHYHKVPCPCPDKNPEIEQAEKFLKEHRDHLSAETSAFLQSKIELVKQAIADNKDIKKAKEQLASDTELAKKTITTLDNKVDLEKSVS